jgi:hypothetical protein
MCTVPTDGNGNLSQSCVVPTSLVQGPYSLVGKDASLAVTRPFTINPGAVVLNTSGQPLASGAPGTAVTLSGSGFAPSATIVKVTMGTHLIGLSPPAITNANGSFSGAAFTVPSIAAGVYTVTVKDIDGNAATVQFTVT